MAASQVSSVWVSAWILPSGKLNVISNRLLAFKDRNASDGCRVSRAQAVRALSPGCLPCILPNMDTLDFSAHDVLRVLSKSSGTLTTNLRLLVGADVLLGVAAMTLVR